MKQLIDHLRQLEAAWKKYEKPEPGEPFPYADQIAEALPQLLDRLEKLETVVELARKVVNYETDRSSLRDVLAALEDK